MKTRHFDTYKIVHVLKPDDESVGLLRREQCTPYEWFLLVEEAQTAAWWDRYWHQRPPVELASMSLCLACNEFTAVETHGTTEDRVRVRCLDCGTHSRHDIDTCEHGVEH